ncbi:MAG: hypothetical protein HC866_10130 [Leptolyngbyaceae cyanobacterium RU_5_1]|nr:hypothetical protein [Leptolyngbyaceae cyanobacterium RU_5_1]
MNNLILGAISSTISFAKSLRLRQFFVAALACFFLLTSTACSSGVTRASNSSAYNSADNAGRYDRVAEPQKELYKPVQPRKGGINMYSDDPKYDADGTKSEARDLIKRVEQNIQTKGARNPGDIVENVRDRNPLGEKARDFSRNIGNLGEELKENITEGSQKGFVSVKKNIERLGENAPRVVDEARQNAMGATKDVREGAKDASQGFQRFADRASNAARDQVKDTANTVRDRA